MGKLTCHPTKLYWLGDRPDLSKETKRYGCAVYFKNEEDCRAFMEWLSLKDLQKRALVWHSQVRADGGCTHCDADQGEAHRPDCPRGTDSRRIVCGLCGKAHPQNEDCRP